MVFRILIIFDFSHFFFFVHFIILLAEATCLSPLSCLECMPTMQGRNTSLNVSLNKSRQIDQSRNDVDNDSFSSMQVTDVAQDEDMDVPEIVEEIIEMLLSGLRDMVCLKGEILIENFVFLLCA